MTLQNNQKEALTLTKTGVRIYSFYTPVHSFNLCLYIPAGPLYEKIGEAGMSHLFEHAVFRNINHLMNGNLYRELDRMGLSLSGATYNELVQISIQGSPKYFEKACEIISLALHSFVITPTELNAEKERVKREIREDTYRSSVDAMSQKTVWEGTGLAETITGTIGNISKVSVSRLVEFSSKVLSSNNVFFYLTGNFTKPQLDFLVKTVSRYPLKTGAPRENIAEIPDNFFNRQNSIFVKRADFCKVKIAYDVDCTKTSKPCRDLVYDILFQGDTSKVFYELSEKNGYVYSFDANLDEYKNIGSLSISFETSASHFAPALKAVKNIFDNIKNNVTEEELAFAKVPYTDNCEFILDDCENLNWNKAWECHILGFDNPDLRSRCQAYSEVTREQAVLTAREIFKSTNLCVAVKHRSPESASNIVKEIFF